MSRKDLVVWFKDVDKEDVALVGGKGANLGEMTKAGFPVPNGFIVTVNAYYAFLEENNLPIKIKNLLNTVNFDKHDSLQQVSNHIKKDIVQGTISHELTKQIFDFYTKLGGMYNDALVAVRSSATAEDLPTASFAGQQETFLNVQGEANLLIKMKEAWASLFDARAIFYRHEQKFDNLTIGIAIPVQKMVNPETSGVMFTLDPVTNDKSKVVIEAIYGLGEYIVQGKVTPDHYETDKKTNQILVKSIAMQNSMYQKSGTKNKEIHIPKKTGEKQKITDTHIKELARLGKKLEHHYYFPQDIEWAIEKDTMYIVQTRPITTSSTKQNSRNKTQETDEQRIAIVTGSPASPGIASGPGRIIHKASEIDTVLQGDVLIAQQTNPDYVPAMRKAAAIITDNGGRTSHAAIVARELGLPAIVGTGNATKVLKTGEVITVNGSKGEVYKGASLQQNSSSAAAPIPYIKTATKIYVNLAQPDLAEKIAAKQVDGVGLLRAEFMIADIGTHPGKLIKDKKEKIFVEKLSEGLETFCRAFYPRPVVYRTSDFKTNEYRNLIGGKEFEPEEPNPMLGFRGAYRYIHDSAVFNLELQAIKKVRNKMNLKNLWIMVPFVRTVEELIEVKKIMASAELHRSPSFKLWMMVEIPSNIILLDTFIACGIDGISIGSNDLTMLLLGTDRDNTTVASGYDEQNDAVLWAFEKAIKTCLKYGITASICGQAPSQYPDLVEKLIEWGITSVSVSPDAIESTRQIVSESEKKLIEKKHR